MWAVRLGFLEFWRKKDSREKRERKDKRKSKDGKGRMQGSGGEGGGSGREMEIERKKERGGNRARPPSHPQPRLSEAPFTSPGEGRGTQRGPTKPVIHDSQWLGPGSFTHGCLSSLMGQSHCPVQLQLLILEAEHGGERVLPQPDLSLPGRSCLHTREDAAQAGEDTSSVSPEPRFRFLRKTIDMVYFLEAGLFFSPISPDMMLNTSRGSRAKPLQSPR